MASRAFQFFAMIMLAGVAAAPCPTTTTTTTTTIANEVVILEGDLTLDVSNPSLFVISPAAILSVQQTIATEAQVPIDAVSVTLTVETSLMQSLMHDSSRSVKQDLTVTGTVYVKYKITEVFGNTQDAQAGGSQTVQKMASVTTQQFTDSINTNLANQGTIVDYTVAVTQTNPPPDFVIEPEPASTTTTTTIDSGYVFVGEGVAQAPGCAGSVASCEPNHMQQTYESITSFDLPATCKAVCSNMPCCFGYAYNDAAAPYYCNVYMTGDVAPDGWTLVPNDSTDISDSSGTEGGSGYSNARTYSTDPYPDVCTTTTTTSTTSSIP